MIEWHYQVLAGPTVLGSGAVSTTSGPSSGLRFDPTQPRPVTLTLQGPLALVTIDGQTLGQFPVPAGFATGGFVALGSGFHAATFDDFFVKGE